ncbi:MAG: hypothetical protein LC637_02145 [Xanthomonadaceae bacterium]|nr:hypothetical protein [Xanthomonadaceae bacterium]
MSNKEFRISRSEAANGGAAHDNPTPAAENTSLDKTIVKLLGFKTDDEESPEKAIAYSTTDYLELTDGSGRTRCSRPAGSSRTCSRMMKMAS